jgi:aspartate dehydrogenase
MTVLSDRRLNVAVGGFGAIGRRVAQALDSGIPGLRLAAVSARDAAKAKQGMSSFAYPVPILSLKDLAAIADIVVDAAPANALREMAEPALRGGRKLVVISVGALLQAGDLIELARRHGGQIIVPVARLLGWMP